MEDGGGQREGIEIAPGSGQEGGTLGARHRDKTALVKKATQQSEEKNPVFESEDTGEGLSRRAGWKR